MMDYRRLGRTGLLVSALGLGTGGFDPLGQRTGRSEDEMVDLIHRAHQLGINYFDTAPGYLDSEPILGRALSSLSRDEVIVSTKIALAGGMPDEPLQIMSADDIAPSVDRSLRRLGLDHIDVLLIAVADDSHYDVVVGEHMPALQRLKDQGKVRFLGSSEQTRSDGAHTWLQRILADDVLDVVMVGHNMINQSATRTVFPQCSNLDVGVVNIYTVRRLFSDAVRLEGALSDLQGSGIIDPDVRPSEALDWLVGRGRADSLIEAAYRYALFTDPVACVMTGTIETEELEQNVAMIGKGPLPSDDLSRLNHMFRNVEEAMGN